jgi:hypothetical protein
MHFGIYCLYGLYCLYRFFNYVTQLDIPLSYLRLILTGYISFLLLSCRNLLPCLLLLSSISIWDAKVESLAAACDPTAAGCVGNILRCTKGFNQVDHD